MRKKLRPLGVLGLAVLFGIAGCGNGTPASPSTGASSSGSVVPGTVAAAMRPIADSAYTAPGPAITGVARLAGKTIWYIPLSSQITTTQLVRASLTQALAKVGMKLYTCSGDTNPSTIAACVTSAVNGGAAGVVFDSITSDFVTNGIKQLEAAHIPALISDEPNPAGASPGTDQLAYLPGNPQQALSVLGQWVAADAGGSTDVLVNEVTDAPPTIAYIENGFIPALKQACAGCTVAVNKIQSANFSLMPSSTLTIGYFATKPAR